MSELDLSSGRPAAAGTPAPALAAVGRGLASPKLGALLTLAAAIALGVGLIVWTVQPEYVPVGERASRAEVLEIVEALGAAGVDYRLDPSTGLVLVPRRELARVRLDLAAAGLDEPGAVGIELLSQDQALGTSHFTETARYQHALETELARTISSLRNVESARVHLALPKQSVFVRERGTASASVTLKVRAGREIEEDQVEAVVSLVSASIPYLDAGQVAVVDQWGRLLSRGEDDGSGATREHYDYARRLERLYSERIESLLAPMVGAERVRAIVTAEVDFSSSERTEEAFEGDPAQLRSEQSESRVSDDAAAVGVPGALTNQPPDEGFVITDGVEVTGLGRDVAGVDRSSSTIRNFELDKTITHVRQAPGGVLRVTAAVVVDDASTVDAEGNAVRVPLSAEDLAQYTALAREAIGFDAARGDSVTVFNRAFRPAEEVPAVEPLPLWEQDWVWTMVRQSLIGLAVLALVLTVLRPAMRRLDPSPARGESARLEELESSGEGRDGEDGEGATAGGGAALAGPDEKADETTALEHPPVVYGDILNMARAMAVEDPRRVAKVVKDWVGEPR